MINLEELKLYLLVIRPDPSYIDGVQLSDQVLNHLPQLQKFTFYIETVVENAESHAPLQTNEAIQRSFSGRDYQQVASFVHNDADNTSGKCQIYSLPYDFEYFLDLDKSFPGGVFLQVRVLTMCDDYPFEDALFRIISQDMPFLEHLQICNTHPQNDKQPPSTVLVFPHLTYLDVEYAHDDYAELLLLKRKTCLLRLSKLRIGYKALRRIKNALTCDSTHSNIHGLKSFIVTQPYTPSESFVEYFSLSEVV